jgi:hypothetical protein
MRDESVDTHPDAEAVQISLIRNATVAKRFEVMRSLTRTVMMLSRRAIQRANPDLDETEIDIKFVAYHYGEDLANRLREYLSRQRT